MVLLIINPQRCMNDKTRLKKVLLKTITDKNGCINFTGMSKGGYGRINRYHKPVYAHRFVYEQLVGKIPKGLVIDHLCRNRKCINIKHLEPVTDKINILRGTSPPAMKAQQTHCKNGHEFTPENTYIHPKGKHRRCLICSKKYQNERARRIKVMKSKNYNNKIVRHGDVIIRPLEMTSLKSIPTEAKDSGNMVVMHGESGNTHMIKNGQVLLLKSPIEIQIPLGTKQVEKFLHIPQDTIITHEEHPTLTVKAGDYVVLQEREMDHMSEVERTVLD